MIDFKKIKDALPKSVQMDLPERAVQLWNPNIKTAEHENSITIFDVIGEDMFGGVSANRISAALRSIGENKPVTVYINSPGGDMFEGVAIYNMLKEHKGDVTVKVIGLAASAASIIAMAGDEIQISDAGFLMIHNAWMVVLGNKHALREVADILEPMDAAMARVYQRRTGMDLEAVQEMMDGETWLDAGAAIENGFADAVLEDVLEEGEHQSLSAKAALRKVDNALAKANIPRSERRELIGKLTSVTPSADEGDDMQNAVDAGELLNLSASLKEILK